MTTPSWNSPHNTEDHSANSVTQFLGTHGVGAIHDGTSTNPLPSSPPGSFFDISLASSYQVAQSFNLPITAIPWLGIATSYIGRGDDMTVSIYTDSAGAPGTLVTSIEVPREVITGQSDQTYTQVFQSLIEFDPSNSVIPWQGIIPGAYGSCASDFMYVVAGGEGISGSSVTTIPTTYAATFGAGGFAPWTKGPDYPTPLSNISLAISADNTTVWGAGGFDAVSALSDLVYSTSIDSNAKMGGWTSQTNLPVACQGGSLQIVGQTLYYIGGQPSLNSTVYAATVTNGTLGAWSIHSILPMITSAVSGVQSHGWIIVTDELDFSGAMYAAKILNETTGEIGPWLTWPSVGVSIVGLASTPTGVHARPLSGNVAYFLPLTANGPGLEWQSTLGVGIAFSGVPAVAVDGSDVPGFIVNDATHSKTIDISVMYPSSVFATAGLSVITSSQLVRVPINVTGLTVSTTYWIVLSQPGTDTNNCVVIETDPSPNNYSYKQGAGSWTVTTGLCVPIRFGASPTTGRPTFTNEDAGAKWTGKYWDFAGKLIAYAEATGDTDTFRTIVYDGSGQTTGVS